MKQVKVNQEMYAQIFKLLMERPVSAHEIVDKVGMHIVNCQGLMRTLKKHGVVHIYSWRTDSRGRDVTPVYVLGEGVDKPRRAKSRAQIARDYRERKLKKLTEGGKQWPSATLTRKNAVAVRGTTPTKQT